MKKCFAIYLSLSITALAMNSCQMSKILRENQAEISRLAYGDLSKQEKFDGLAEELVDVLETSLTLPSPVKTFRYLDKFTQQNERELNSLAAELGPWIKEMKLGEKIRFTTNVMSSPYSKQLVQVVPKVRQMAKENGYKLGTLDKILLIYKLKGLIR